MIDCLLFKPLHSEYGLVISDIIAYALNSRIYCSHIQYITLSLFSIPDFIHSFTFILSLLVTPVIDKELEVSFFLGKVYS